MSSSPDSTDRTDPRALARWARELGVDPQSGKPVSVRMGRFGPFVQIGTRDDEDKPRFAGLRPGQKMDTIKLDAALQLFQLPRKLGTTPEGEALEANIGRFGPYVKFGSKYASLKAEDDPYTITLERAIEVVAAKKLAGPPTAAKPTIIVRMPPTTMADPWNRSAQATAFRPPAVV